MNPSAFTDTTAGDPAIYRRPRSRSTDPATSKAAGKAASLYESQKAVAIILHGNRRGMTDEEIRTLAEECDIPYSPSRLRSARAELVALGRVKAIGLGRSRYGRKTQTWALA